MSPPVSLRGFWPPWTEWTCSPLFAIGPEGLDTGMQESLPSYFARIAARHSIAPISLLRFLEDDSGRLVTMTGINSRVFLLSGKTSRRLASALEHATCGQPALTLVHKKLCEFVGVYRETRLHAAWCPQCIRDWKDSNSIVFRPLLWSLNCVSCCPIHDAALVDQCPQCAQKYYQLSPRPWDERCKRCNTNFAEETSGRAPTSFESFSARTAKELLTWSLSKDSCPSLETFRSNIRTLIKHAGDQYKAAKVLEIPRPTIRLWSSAIRRPLLSTIVRLSYRFKLPPHILFTTYLPADSFANPQPFPNDVKDWRPYRKHPSAATIRAAVAAHLQDHHSRPLSLRVLAASIGTSEHRVYAAASDLTPLIAKRRARSVKRQTRLQQMERIRVVRKKIVEFQTQGRPLTCNAIKQELVADGIRSLWRLKSVVSTEVSRAQIKSGLTTK